MCVATLSFTAVLEKMYCLCVLRIILISCDILFQIYHRQLTLRCHLVVGGVLAK